MQSIVHYIHTYHYVHKLYIDIVLAKMLEYTIYQIWLYPVSAVGFQMQLCIYLLYEVALHVEIFPTLSNVVNAHPLYPYYKIMHYLSTNSAQNVLCTHLSLLSDSLETMSTCSCPIKRSFCLSSIVLLRLCCKLSLSMEICSTWDRRLWISPWNVFKAIWRRTTQERVK